MWVVGFVVDQGFALTRPSAGLKAENETADENVEQAEWRLYYVINIKIHTGCTSTENRSSTGPKGRL